jgi:hypothetical protein
VSRRTSLPCARSYAGSFAEVRKRLNLIPVGVVFHTLLQVVIRVFPPEQSSGDRATRKQSVTGMFAFCRRIDMCSSEAGSSALCAGGGARSWTSRSDPGQRGLAAMALALIGARMAAKAHPGD